MFGLKRKYFDTLAEVKKTWGCLMNDVRTYYYNNPVERELIKHTMQVLKNGAFSIKPYTNLCLNFAILQL